MNRIYYLFLIFSFRIFVYAEPLDLHVNAAGAILMNADTGAILYEKKAHQVFHPASITKTATALYALKLKGDCLDEIVIADSDEISAITEEAMQKAAYSLPAYRLTFGGTHIGLRKGEKMTFRDLLYGMMLQSGNDASNVIARFAAGSIPQFMTGLNAHLKQIGCEKTRFVNPHGLFHPEHQTTAYEMALITREALKNPEFRKIVSTTHYKRPKTNIQEPSLFVQTNKLLRNGKYKYSKAIGVKTGYHSRAENTLVAAAQDGDRVLIAVLLKTKERSDAFLDAIKLFETAFAQPKVTKIILSAGHQPFETLPSGSGKKVSTYLDKDLSITYFPAEEPNVKCYLEWDSELKAPIKPGQKVGTLKIQTGEGKVIAGAPLLAENQVDLSWFNWITNFF